MSAEDRLVATWSQSTGCGTRHEALTADGQVHVDYAPPLGEPRFEGDDAPTTTRSATARASCASSA